MQVAVPLLWLRSGEPTWYKLKEKNLKREARGKHPEILLQVDLQWNT